MSILDTAMAKNRKKGRGLIKSPMWIRKTKMAPMTSMLPVVMRKTAAQKKRIRFGRSAVFFDFMTAPPYNQVRVP